MNAAAGATALLFAAVLSTGPAAAGCGPDKPGYRDGAGKCVTWQSLEMRCGIPPGDRCRPDDPDPAVEDLVATPKGDPSAGGCSGCGCKGGPGYRGPDGRCVGWKQLSKVCGAPLPGRCKAEITDGRADAVADQQGALRAHPGRPRKAPATDSEEPAPSPDGEE